MMKNVCIYDTEKSTTITDVMGIVRYIIQLSIEEMPIEDSIDDKTPLSGYVVTTYRTDGETKLQIDRYPEENVDNDYCRIKRVFNDTVKKFAQIVEAETCNLNELEIYKERINYKLTSPECCSTCKWCRYVHAPRNCNPHDHMIYECHNPNNYQMFMYNKCVPEIHTSMHKERCNCDDDRHGWRKLPWQHDTYDRFDKRGELPLNKTFVKVSSLGICDSYERNS